MKKIISIGIVFALMITMTGCGLFTEKRYVYSVDSEGTRVLTDIYTYDDNGNQLDHMEILDS